jgi:hypothetical protein
MAAKKIEVQIVATGGNQAAAEINKVTRSATSLAGSGGVAGGLGGLATQTQKVTAANVKMGTGMLKVGSQVQNLAGNLSKGTGAFRALGQQLPKLISGIGPVGIALGTVSAVAIPLAGVLFDLGESAEAAGEKGEVAAGKLEELNKVRAKKSAEAAVADNQAFIDSLDDEERGITQVNTALQYNIDLLQAKRRAQLEVDSAQAALEVAEIDADDNLSDEDKIKARAAVIQGLERKKFEGRKADAADRVADADQVAVTATDAADRKAADVESTRQQLADQEAEKVELRGRIGAANRAQASLPEIDEKIKAQSTPIPFIPHAGDLTQRLEAGRQSQVAELQAQRDQLALDAGGANSTDRNRLAEITGEVIPQTKSAIEKLTKAAADLATTAEDARAKAQSVREVETAGVKGDFRATSLKLNAGRVTSGSAAKKAKESRIKETEKATADAERKRDEETLRNKQDTLDSDSKSAAGRIFRGAKKNKAARQVAVALENGTNENEIAKLTRLVNEQSGKMGQTMLTALREVLAGLARQSQEISTLRGQIKNNRTGQ